MNTMFTFLSFKTRILFLCGLLVAVSALALPASARLQHTIVGHADYAVRSLVGPMVHSDGFLYVASNDGGTSHGAILRLSLATGAFETVHTFTGGAGGSSPSGLIEGGDGALYGVAWTGGDNGGGLLFRLTKSGTFTVLHHFANATGRQPYHTPIQGSDGHLYGIVGFGATYGNGGIYRYNLGTSTYTLFRSFTGTTGATPGKGAQAGGLIELPDGKLYGRTRFGGAHDTGVFFAIDRTTASYSAVYEFDPGILAYPNTPLMLGSDGFFYGSTGSDSEPTHHALFRIAPDGTGFRILHRFSSSPDDLTPQFPFVEGSDGRIYGVSSITATGTGSSFRFQKEGKAFVTLRRFDKAENDSKSPSGPLLEVSPGVFYGTTNRGGNHGWGTVYRLETTLEAPAIKIPAAVRKSFTGNIINLKGTSKDDLQVSRVEYSSGRGWKTATGTTNWRGLVRVKGSAKSQKIRVRAYDNDALLSRTTTIRPRRIP
jgi:uncharacterized repeat protein (TIGR03803 family)